MKHHKVLSAFLALTLVVLQFQSFAPTIYANNTPVPIILDPTDPQAAGTETGATYDSGVLNITYSQNSSSGFNVVISTLVNGGNLNLSFGYFNNPQFINNSPTTTFGVNPVSQGLYSIGGTALDITETIVPAAFAVYDEGVTFFKDNSSVASPFTTGDVNFSFSAASKNSTNFTYCLTQDINLQTGEPAPDSCQKTANFNFGEIVEITNQWNDLVAGTYYLALSDTNNWLADSTELTILDPLDISINSAVFDVTENFTLEVTFTGGEAPYTLNFKDLISTNITNIFGTYNNAVSPVAITSDNLTAGFYSTYVSSAFVSNSDEEVFVVFPENENLLLDINTSDRYFIQDDFQASFKVAGATRSQANVTYCLTSAVDGRQADALCEAEGTLTFASPVTENTVSVGNLNTGTYYLTLTDGTHWAEPIEIFIIEAVNFTILEETEDFTVGEPLNITIAPTGGIAPYAVYLHRKSGANFANTGTAIASNISTNTLLTYTIPTSGQYGFKVVDSVNNESYIGFQNPAEWGGDFLTAFPANSTIFIDYTQGDLRVAGGFANTNFSVVQKVGDQFYYCLTEEANANQNQVIADENCEASATTNMDPFIFWQLPEEPATYKILAQNTSDSSWADAVTIDIDHFKVRINETTLNSFEATVGDSITLNSNNSCTAMSSCSYFVHASNDVNIDNTTYSQVDLFGEAAEFDTTNWAAGTYYIKSYNSNNTLYSSNTIILTLLVANSPEFTLNIISDDEFTVAQPFISKTLLINDLAVDNNLATVFWPQASSATGPANWTPNIAVTATNQVENFSADLREQFKENSQLFKVTVSTGANGSVLLSDEVIIAIPIAGGVQSLDNPSVLIRDASNNITPVTECTEVQFTGNPAQSNSVLNNNNFHLNANSACYLIGTEALSNYLYIATRHLSDFVVGEQGQAEEGEGEGEGDDNEEEGQDPQDNDPPAQNNQPGRTTVSGSNPQLSSLQILTNKALNQQPHIFNHFPDLEKSPALFAVNALREIGVVEGREGGLFYPHEAITRAEFLKIVTLLNRLPSGPTTEPLFQDVLSNSWFTPFINIAQYNGLITTHNTHFRPNDHINLAEATTIIYRMLGANADQFVAEHITPPTFNRAAWYYRPITFVNAKRYLNNYNPETKISRAEAVVLLYNLFAK